MSWKDSSGFLETDFFLPTEQMAEENEAGSSSESDEEIEE